MQRLIAEERNVRVLREKIVQCSRASFLDTAHNEVDVVDFSPLKKT
jgi:hypothetical protein